MPCPDYGGISTLHSGGPNGTCALVPMLHLKSRTLVCKAETPSVSSVAPNFFHSHLRKSELVRKHSSSYHKTLPKGLRMVGYARDERKIGCKMK
jgi:hypothetical protein